MTPIAPAHPSQALLVPCEMGVHLSALRLTRRARSSSERVIASSSACSLASAFSDHEVASTSSKLYRMSALCGRRLRRRQIGVGNSVPNTYSRTGTVMRGAFLTAQPIVPTLTSAEA
jgi:hypothetical protein